jgi:hypothetical protein
MVSTAAITPTAIHVPRLPVSSLSSLVLLLVELVCLLLVVLNVAARLVSAFRKVFPEATRASMSLFEKRRFKVVFEPILSAIISAAASGTNWVSEEEAVAVASLLLEVSAATVSVVGSLADDVFGVLESLLALMGPAIT